MIQSRAREDRFSLRNDMGLIEERTAHVWICCENSSDCLALAAADVGDVPEPREVVALQQRRHRTTGQRCHGEVEDFILGGMLSAVLPNRLAAVQFGERIFTSPDAVQKMAPRLPHIGSSNQCRPSAD